MIPGSYVVEGVEIAKPVTIQGLGNGTAVIQTSVALSAFFVNGYEAGRVLIDGLTFDFDTPTGPTTATRSYPIRAHGTYDQLIIQNSIFNIDPLARGSIFTEQSTVATAATFVDNVEITGGVFGVAVGNNHTEVTNSHISGAGNGVYYFGTPTPPTGRVEGSVFVDCGNQCVRVGGGGDVDVISNTFGQCRLRRCVTVVNGAQSEVRSNTFAAQVLTGDPANQVVLFTSTTTGVIDNNTFAGCGFDECLFIAGAVTISNNHFTQTST